MNRLSVLAVALVASACASTGATFRSGVGDRQLEHPPYYAGAAATSLPASASIARLPIVYQRGASHAPIFDPAGASGEVSALIREMNQFADSAFANPKAVVPAAEALVPPNVYFGCELDASNDCIERGDSVLGRRGTTMRLAVERPSGEWIARLQSTLDSAGATHALIITLEVGQYWTRQSGLRGAKSVELGTAHVASLPWLTSLETPVTVLQLTGALIGRDGKAVRIGAEGLLAVRTPLAASGAGMQRILGDADMSRARSQRHADRAGQPLVWQAALDALMQQLGATRVAVAAGSR